MNEPSASPPGKLSEAFPTLVPLVKKSLILLLCLAILLTIAVVTFEITAAKRLSTAENTAREAGVILSMEDYRTKYETDVLSQAATAHYEKAFEAARSFDWSEYQMLWEIGRPDVLPCEPYGDECRQRLSVFVNKHRETLDELALARAAGPCRQPITWIKDKLLVPTFSNPASSGFILNVAIALAAEEGRGADGVALIRDGLAMIRSYDQAPLISTAEKTFRICELLLGEESERLFALADIPPEELAALQDDIERFADEYSILPALQGEFAYLSDILGVLATGATSDEIREYAYFPGLKLLDKTPLVLKRGYIKSEKAIVIRHISEIMKEAKNPSESLRSKNRADIEAIMKKDYFFFLSAPLLPKLNSATTQADKHRARLRTAAAAIAALRFRNDNERFPDSLAEMVPGYLDKIPMDPLRPETPLVYLAEGDQVTIYSVGGNCRDDGGDRKYDVVFSIWRKAKTNER